MSCRIDGGKGEIVVLFVGSNGVVVNLEEFFGLTSPLLDFVPFQLIDPCKCTWSIDNEIKLTIVEQHLPFAKEEYNIISEVLSDVKSKSLINSIVAGCVVYVDVRGNTKLLPVSTLKVCIGVSI